MGFTTLFEEPSIGAVLKRHADYRAFLSRTAKRVILGPSQNDPFLTHFWEPFLDHILPNTYETGGTFEIMVQKYPCFDPKLVYFGAKTDKMTQIDPKYFSNVFLRF
jgi:hypothetical protein